MGYSVISIIVLCLGLYLLFTKDVLRSVLLSFIMTLILFSVLVVKELYILALSYLIMDPLIKLVLFLYFTNKKIESKPIVFLKNQKFRKFLTVVVASIFVGSIYVTNTSIKTTLIVERKTSLELMIVSLIVVIFITSGYVIKSEKWKR